MELRLKSIVSTYMERRQTLLNIMKRWFRFPRIVTSATTGAPLRATMRSKIFLCIIRIKIGQINIFWIWTSILWIKNQSQIAHYSMFLKFTRMRDLRSKLLLMVTTFADQKGTFYK